MLRKTIIAILLVPAILLAQQGVVILRDRNSTNQAEVSTAGAVLVESAASGGSAGILAVGGAAADGSAVASNPVPVAGVDGSGNTQTILVSTIGVPRTNIYDWDNSVGLDLIDGDDDNVSDGTVGAIGASRLYGVNSSSTYARLRSNDASNNTIATTLTGRNEIGILKVEKDARWSVVSNPAAGTRASASIAGEASVSHVVDCVAFSATAVSMPGSGSLTVNLRDGTSGTGNIIWGWVVTVAAATGQSIQPFHACGLNLMGTSAGGMTLEFSSGTTNLIQHVSMSGYNLN